MEKLKCSSCGGEITVDDDKEYGTCPYCGTKYKLNEDINFNIKMDDNTKEVLTSGAKHFSKFMFIPFIMFFVIFAFVIFSFFSFGSKGNKSSFNFQFSNVSGTKDAFFIDSTLDKIVESNNTHDRKVALVFEGKETTDKTEIIDIKHSLSGKYEVSLEYEKGYVSKVVLEKVEEKENKYSQIYEQIDETRKRVESSNEELKKQVEEMQEQAKEFFN
jgi:rRNA maturation endonuclease Nob1